MYGLKPGTTIKDQIKLLRSRGMEVDDDKAKQWLTNVSYYRLSAYWYPARFQHTEADKFQPGTNFSNAVALYEADRKLRTLIHDAIERIEITMRTRIGQHFAVSDPLFYEDPANFRQTFQHDQWLATASKRLDRAGRTNEAIKHYQSKYNGRYPFWVLAEVLDFSDISRLFDGLLAADQRRIAEDLGLFIEIDSLSVNQQRRVRKASPFARWLEQLTIIRNTCAHHGRLWNKSFTPVSTVALKTNSKFSLLPDNQSERIFGAIVLIAHLLEIASPGTRWSSKVTELLMTEFVNNPLVQESSMGIPSHWNGSFTAAQELH